MSNVTQPSVQIFEIDETHPAPRLSAECGFPITVREQGAYRDTIHLDQNGNYVWESLVSQHAQVTITNTLNGRSLTSIEAGLIKYTETNASSAGLSARFIIPGVGIILIETGRLVFDFAKGTFVFEAGPHDKTDGNVAGLCQAIG